MKKKEFRIANLTILCIMAAFILLTVKLSSNASLPQVLASLMPFGRDQSADQPAVRPCSAAAPLVIESTEPHLAKLAAYQAACRSFAASHLMLFTAFPETTESAQQQAETMAVTLRQFHTAGVTPIVIVEPYIDSGPMPYKAYLSGQYDTPLARYFDSLKALGITDAMMGMWVPFPESNTPSWENKDTEPRDFAAAVSRYLSSLKGVFPNAKGSILLNATTYEPTDLEYENGDYLSFTPYIQDIQPGLVDSVGVQGFPWVSRATQARREIFRASEFLQPDYAIEAAKELRTRDIWFNTGSFASKYTTDPEQRVELTVSDRKAILAGILEEARKLNTLQQNEYRIMINIFAEDKSDTTEATDWSYLNDPATQSILVEFLEASHRADIIVGLYDK